MPETSEDKSPSKKLVLFLGYGYVAKFVVDELIKNDFAHIILSTRNVPKVKKALFQKFFQRLTKAPAEDTTKKASLPLDAIMTSLEQNNINIETPSLTNQKASQFNYDAFVQEKLPYVTHILITAPPVGQKDPAFEKYHSLFLENKCPNLEWVGYLSATSVYGDMQGEECDEDTPLNPISQRGKNRAHAETIWMSLFKTHNIPTHIFRLTGIYGPDRNNISDIKNEKAISIIKEGHLNNRVYVKDIARALIHSMKNPTPGEIYNITDDMVASTAAVNDYIAFMLGVKQPKKVLYSEAKETMSEMRKSFFQENKIVSNKKIKEKLGFTFKFPSYRDGIPDIIKPIIGSNDNKQ